MDLLVVETNNGGDLLKKGNDLAMVESFENMPYLAMFGGNKEASTPTKRIESEQAFDWWGNSLMPNDPSIQFNSLTERTLESTQLSSSGRIVIEEAIQKDLEFMNPFAEVTVSTAITGPDRLQINLGIKKPGNLTEKKYIYIWEGGNLNTLDLDITYEPNPITPTEGGLQYELQFRI